MKSSKFKTFLLVLSLLSVGLIMLGYKLYPRQFSDMGSSIASAIKGRRKENAAVSPIINQRSVDSITFKCRTGGSACLLWQKKKLSKMMASGVISLHFPTSPAVLGRVLPSEDAFLHHKPLEDLLKSGDGKESTVEIVGKKKGYRKNDYLTVLVTIRNGYGHRTSHGGDHVRVWMVGDDERKASLATEVNDLGNGSYIATLPLSWSGSATVKASLVYNAAVQRAHYYVRYVIKSTRYMGAGFTSYFSNEITLCSPFRKRLRYSKVCDFTELNGGMPWFCGKPKDRTLECRHWSLNFDFNFVSSLPATAAEKEWWAIINKTNPERMIPIGSGVKLLVGEQQMDESKQTNNKKVPCEQMSLRESWYAPAPRGHFLDQKWIPVRCSLDTLTENRRNECLKDTTVLTMGDSNARAMFEYLVYQTGCVMKKEKRPTWHSPMECYNNKTGTVFRWRSHALPFHLGSHDGADRTNQKPVHQFIDEIPEEGRFLVIVHLYIHFTAHRDEIFITHIRAVRRSVEKLLGRNPNTNVVIRGPHIFQQNWFTPGGGDIAGPFYTEYIKMTFKGLKDRVFFLQPWDMTVAMENKDLHPPKFVTQAMWDVVLGHLCR